MGGQRRAPSGPVVAAAGPSPGIGAAPAGMRSAVAPSAGPSQAGLVATSHRLALACKSRSAVRLQACDHSRPPVHASAK